jgi:hypothetical protein
MSRKGGKPAGHFPADRMLLDRVGRPVGPLQLPVCFAFDRPADGRPCDAQSLARLGGAVLAGIRQRDQVATNALPVARRWIPRSTSTLDRHEKWAGGGWSIWPAGHSR